MQRSRLAWSWLDQIEAPSDPAVHGYRFRVTGAAGTIERECPDSSTVLSPAETVSLGPGPIEVEVRQVGTLAVSRPAAITINA